MDLCDRRGGDRHRVDLAKHGVDGPAQVRLVYLGADPQTIIAVPTEQSTRGLEKKVSAIWTAVERACEREDFRPKPSALCNWCAFKAWCPSFGGDPSTAQVDLTTREVAAPVAG